ncbi:MAG: hypothetical protein H6Q60_795 [Oscillospiraceae bacterium]|nr:hypothetical protein [Oscillospiraceae bacterium]
MTLNQIQYFIEVANCQSFSIAAQNLYISQPNLSKYIANLEKELHLKLFKRSTHHVRLTAEGEALLRKTEMLYFRLARAIEEVQIESHNQFQQVSIGISRDEMLPQKLMDLLYEKNTNGSLIRYNLMEDTYLNLIAKLSKQQYDMAVTTDRNMRKTNGINFIKLSPFSLVLAVNKRHPKAGLPHLKPTDFLDEPVFLALPDGKDFPHEVIQSVFQNAGGVLNLRLMDSPRDLMLNVQAGAGVALVSSLISRSNYPDVCFCSYDERPDAMQCIAWRSDETNSAVLDMVQSIKNIW